MFSINTHDMMMTTTIMLFVVLIVIISMLMMTMVVMRRWIVEKLSLTNSYLVIFVFQYQITWTAYVDISKNPEAYALLCTHPSEPAAETKCCAAIFKSRYLISQTTNCNWYIVYTFACSINETVSFDIACTLT